MRLYLIVHKIRRIEMQQIILGSAGFLLYFIYDINSVRKQNRLLQNFSQRALFWLFCHCSWNFGLHGDSAVTGSEE